MFTWIPKLCLKFTHLKSQLNLLGDNELIHLNKAGCLGERMILRDLVCQSSQN